MKIQVLIRNEYDVGYGGICDTSDVADAYPQQIRALVADGLAALRLQVLDGKADHLWCEIRPEELP